MNRLYGIITGSANELGYYAKRCDRPRLTRLGESLRRALIGRVPEASLGLLACILCRHSQDTVYGSEIRALDPVNSYGDLNRPPDSDPLDPKLLSRSVETDRRELIRCIPSLDADIRDRLVSKDWLELSSAICLQLLREASDAQ